LEIEVEVFVSVSLSSQQLSSQAIVSITVISLQVVEVNIQLPNLVFVPFEHLGHDLNWLKGLILSMNSKILFQ
jgi:hypothetical protein